MTETVTQSTKSIPMLDLALQYQSIREEIQAAIASVLDSQHFILGPEVAWLEQELAHFCGRRWGIGVASGTDALVLALRACGIGPGDQVVVPSFTFIATADAVSLLGARPVFADIEPTTFCLDPSQLNQVINDRTKAVVVVHLYGHPANMNPIVETARKRNIAVIEDNAQAIGATYHGRRTGSLGDIACLSFFPSKNLGAYGDAGMIVTDCEKTALKLRSLRAHGMTTKYVSAEQGWNSRLDELQAAILRAKFRHLEMWTRQRRSRAALYTALLADLPMVTVPATAECCEHVFHQFTIRVPHRDAVQRALSARGVASTVYYPVPIHLQPIYSSLGWKRGDMPESERAASEVLSLPMYPELTDEHIEFIVDSLKDVLCRIGEESLLP